MINNYEDYKYYLEADRISLRRQRDFRQLRFDRVWKFQRLLRKLEYQINSGAPRLIRLLTQIQYFRLSEKLGFSMPPSVFGPGLSIAHRGTIVITGAVKVGKNCRIHVCVNIGTKAGERSACPTIGDNCYIGPGAKIFGAIGIGDDIAIGANAVVTKSFEEGNCAIGGVPAKVISSQGSQGLMVCGADLVER